MSRQFKAAAAFTDKPYTHIPLTPVQSGQIGAIGYSMDSGTLAVTFARGLGAVYHYPGVSPELHQQFMAAESKGEFFGQHIKALAFDKFPGDVLQQASAAPVAAAVTPETIAAKLHGTEYPMRGVEVVMAEAKANGIVVVYGASDDLMELEGAIRDEFGCYDGGTAKLDAKGLLRDWDSVKEDGDKEETAAWLERDKTAKEIKALWAPDQPEGASWAYETSIPHVTFDVMEDGGIYCRGIVFKLADLSS